MNACYPTLPGKKRKAKCYSISSTQKHSPPSSNPEHGIETSLSTKTETQPGVSQLLAPYQGDLGKLPGSDWGLCRSSLPAGTGLLGKGENVIQPEHKGQDGISLLVWWSHVLGKIYLAVPGQSPGGCRAGLIPALFTCAEAPCETLMAVAQRGSEWLLPPCQWPPGALWERGMTMLTQLGTCQYWRCQLDQRQQPESYREICHQKHARSEEHRHEIFPSWNPDSTEGNRRAVIAFWTERATIQVFV